MKSTTGPIAKVTGRNRTEQPLVAQSRTGSSRRGGSMTETAWPRSIDNLGTNYRFPWRQLHRSRRVSEPICEDDRECEAREIREITV